MAIIQIITLSFIVKKEDLMTIINMPYWFLGPVVFILIEKYIFLEIDDQNYIRYSNIFLFIVGLILLIKTLN